MTNIDQMLHEKLQTAIDLSNKRMQEVEKMEQPFSGNSLQELTLSFMEGNKFYAELLKQLMFQIDNNPKSI